MGTSLSWGTDTQLYDAVRLRLDEDRQIRARDIAVAACDGVITLTGFVDSYADTRAAEEAVKRVRGVRAIADDIDVKVFDERTDSEIAKDAIHALDRNTKIAGRVTVTVRHGFVRLDGAVECMSEKDAAECAVKDLKGVRAVSNHVCLSQTPTSVEVAVRIEQAFARSAASDAARVRVEVIDGTVTLSGSVQSWAEFREAEEAAWSSPGVAQVDNRLTVAS
jgi:osmotically-inducible protein OsmY